MAREYLATLREKQNESQQDVANALGISRQYYSMVETGDRQKRMDMVLLSGLATHFGLSLSEMADLEQFYAAAQTPGQQPKPTAEGR